MKYVADDGKMFGTPKEYLAYKCTTKIYLFDKYGSPAESMDKTFYICAPRAKATCGDDSEWFAFEDKYVRDWISEAEIDKAIETLTALKRNIAQIASNLNEH